MLKVGLTGGIGSGKSCATAIFEKLGVTIIDADVIAHQLTTPGSETLLDIKNQLGAQFITSQGELDRTSMAKFVFEHPGEKAALENILHPRVKKEMIREIKEQTSSAYLILAVPLLLETDFTELVDQILVIDAPEEIRIRRAVERDGRNIDEIKAIIKHQVNREFRLEKANTVLDNSGTLDMLESSIKQLHNQYLQISNQ